ncbi:MAG: hypothetical protein ACTHOR_17850 [Devosia sp.]
MTGNERELGILSAKAEGMEQDIAELKTMVARLSTDVGQLNLTLAGVKGAWRFALVVTGIVSAFIGWTLQALPFFHKGP